MRILDLFAGIGGFSLAGHWAGHETVAFVEKDPFCLQVLKKNFGGVPIYGDIKEFDGTQYTGVVDIICGGFPCQPFSVAGKRKGTDDDRHLWPQMLRVIREVKPTWVIGENVGGFVTIGEGMVFEQTCLDLENEGYEVQAFIIPAVAVNAPHRRDRVWIVAHAVSDADRARPGEIPEEDGVQSLDRSKMGSWEFIGADNDITADYDSEWESQSERDERDKRGWTGDSYQQTAPDASATGLQRDELAGASESGAGLSRPAPKFTWDDDWVEVATALCGVDDGLPARLDGFEQSNKVGELYSKAKHRTERLKSLGNSIVPQVAYEILKSIQEIENHV